ncbi:MAG: tail fiber domain-containing protein [Ferruginibacter sp.]
MKKIITLILFVTVITNVYSQNIAINETGAQPDTSAMLDISSTTKGFLIPRMTKTQRNAIALPGIGLMVFQTGPDSVGFHYYSGTQWLWLATSNNHEGWSTTGNAGTDSAVNFLGTLDDKPLMLRQNNLWMGQLNTKKHNFFIGGGAGAINVAGQNTGFGDSALARNSAGLGNTAVGYRSMAGGSNITGGLNTAVGNNTLSAVTTGYQNIAIGDNAMTSMKTGATNVIAGAGAMEVASKGDGNIALGLWALRTNDSASYNIAIGTSALYSNDSSRNIAIGYQSLYRNNRAGNTAIGHQAGHLNNFMQTGILQGIENTYIGYQSGYQANTGSKNVAIGHAALKGGGYFTNDEPNNVYYKRNVAIGDSAMVASLGSDNVAIGFKTLSKSGTGGAFVAVGGRALSNTTANYPNTAIGYSSQDSNSLGGANTSVGSYSLTKNTSGYNNTAIGNAAMYEAVNTVNPEFVYDNTAVGNDALRLARYYGETAIGAGALRNDTGSLYNTAIGYLAMHYHQKGNSNTAVGTSALRFDLTGEQNTAVGLNAMYNHKTGGSNTAVGTYSLFNDTSGYANVALGGSALFNHFKNDFNTAVGFESMQYDKTGSLNTAVGWRSLRNAKNPNENTVLGVGALEYSDSAVYNVVVGRGAMMGKGGKYNTAVGYMSSGMNNGAPSTSYYVNETTTIGYMAGFRNIADQNTFVGTGAGFGGVDSLRGIENTGVGTYALYYTTTGKSNTALGIGAMQNNSTGRGNVGIGTRVLTTSNTNYNIAIGDSALFTNNGNSNLAVGTFSMRNNNTGENNTATGNYSLQSNVNGSKNAAFGDSALYTNNNGSNNTAIGHAALLANQTGSNNTAVGYNANTSSSNLTNTTAVGANALVGQNNTLVLGSIKDINGAANDTKVGIGTITPDSIFSVSDKLMVGSSGTIQFENSVPVMNYMFTSGSNNPNRMIVAHSPSFSNYGLQYQDWGDRFHFLGNGTSVMTVDLVNQRVGIGVSTPTHQLHLSTDDAAKLTTSTWATTSDMRLKKLDGNYTKGLKDIIKLNTIMYHYAPGNARNLSCEAQGYGFSAQEVQKIFPEAVREEKDGYLSLNIHPILVAYVNAFKEQQEEIEALKQQVSAEKNTANDTLEKLMKRIEALEAKLSTVK